MKLFYKVVQMVRNSDRLTEMMGKFVETQTNQSTDLNTRLDQLVEGHNNQSTDLNTRLDQLVEGQINQSTDLNTRLDQLVEGQINQSTDLNTRLDRLVEEQINQSTDLNKRLDQLVDGEINQATAVNERLDRLLETLIDKLNLQHYAQSVQIELLRQLLKASRNPPWQAPVQTTALPRGIYVCHGGHEHDRIYTENVAEYLAVRGIECTEVEFGESGLRPQLEQCLDGGAAVLGFNSQLDHSWLQSGSFLEVAARKQVPVIQWILDHPSVRWPEFVNSNPANSLFLLNSDHCKAYFDRYCLPGARSASIAGVGPNRRSRIAELSRTQFFARDVNCLIALGLTRAGRGPEATQADIAALDTTLAAAVGEATELARLDLTQPLELHLAAVLGGYGRKVTDRTFNECFRLVEELVQSWRRRRIFAVARDYPVLVQSDAAAMPLLEGGHAICLQDVSMSATIARMPACRAVLSVSYLNDMVHDRTLNGWNAGCVNIVEDNLIQRSVLRHGDNALLFRYDDDSLRECLEIVCHQPERAYAIAEAGMTLRDDPRFRFGGFDCILALARQ